MGSLTLWKSLLKELKTKWQIWRKYLQSPYLTSGKITIRYLNIIFIKSTRTMTQYNQHFWFWVSSANFMALYFAQIPSSHYLCNRFEKIQGKPEESEFPKDDKRGCSSSISFPEDCHYLTSQWFYSKTPLPKLPWHDLIESSNCAIKYFSQWAPVSHKVTTKLSRDFSGHTWQSTYILFFPQEKKSLNNINTGEEYLIIRFLSCYSSSFPPI